MMVASAGSSDATTIPIHALIQNRNFDELQRRLQKIDTSKKDRLEQTTQFLECLRIADKITSSLDLLKNCQKEVVESLSIAFHILVQFDKSLLEKESSAVGSILSMRALPVGAIQAASDAGIFLDSRIVSSLLQLYSIHHRADLLAEFAVSRYSNLVTECCTRELKSSSAKSPMFELLMATGQIRSVYPKSEFSAKNFETYLRNEELRELLIKNVLSPEDDLESFQNKPKSTRRL